MRPRPIIWFEHLMIASILIGLAEAALGWRHLAAQYETMSASPDWIAALVVLLTFGLVLLLTLLASRRRNGAALVLLLLLFIGGLPQIARQLIAAGLGGAQPLSLLGFIAQLAAFALAAVGPSRRWFGPRGQDTADDMRADADALQR